MSDPLGAVVGVLQVTTAAAKVPRFADSVDSKSGGLLGPRFAAVICGPDGSQLLIGAGSHWPRSATAHVWAPPGTLLGIVRGGGWGTVLKFRTWTCGRSHRKCVCGASEGAVRKPDSSGRWAIQWASEGPGSYVGWIGYGGEDVRRDRFGEEPAAIDKSIVKEVGLGRRFLAGWLPSTAPPILCNALDLCRGFDWLQHGLLLALAAICDPRVRGLALPESGGGA